MVQYPPWIDQLGKYYQTKCNLFCSGNLANPSISHRFTHYFYSARYLFVQLPTRWTGRWDIITRFLISGFFHVPGTLISSLPDFFSKTRGDIRNSGCTAIVTTTLVVKGKNVETEGLFLFFRHFWLTVCPYTVYELFV